MTDQDKRTSEGDAAMIENLHYVKALGVDIKQALERGDTHQFGRLMHQHWEMKRKRSSNMSNGKINRWYSEHVLLDQEFANAEKFKGSISKLLKSKGEVKIVVYRRLEVGG